MEKDRKLLKTTFSIPSRSTIGPRWFASVVKRLAEVLAAAPGLFWRAPFFVSSERLNL